MGFDTEVIYWKKKIKSANWTISLLFSKLFENFPYNFLLIIIILLFKEIDFAWGETDMVHSVDVSICSLGVITDLRTNFDNIPVNYVKNEASLLLLIFNWF